MLLYDRVMQFLLVSLLVIALVGGTAGPGPGAFMTAVDVEFEAAGVSLFEGPLLEWAESLPGMNAQAVRLFAILARGLTFSEQLAIVMGMASEYIPAADLPASPEALLRDSPVLSQMEELFGEPTVNAMLANPLVPLIAAELDLQDPRLDFFDALDYFFGHGVTQNLLQMDELDRNTALGVLLGGFAAGRLAAEADILTDLVDLMLYDGIRVTVDGARVAFPAGQGPMLAEGHTLLPARVIFEILGFDVAWDADTDTAIFTNPRYELRVAIGSSMYFVNGEPRPHDVPAALISGRTMMSVGLLESVGFVVEFRAAPRAVLITTSPAE